VTAKAPAGSKISVYPGSGTIAPGRSQTFQITVSSSAPSGQYFGQIDFRSDSGPRLHLPVAFNNRQGDVSLSSVCRPATIPVRATTTCTVTADNSSVGEAAVVAKSVVTDGLKITDATGATPERGGASAAVGPVILAAPKDAIPAIAPGDTPVGGYVGLEKYGIAPKAIGDEENVNYTVPGYLYGGKTYTAVGVDSNGYISVGGTSDAADISFQPQTFPNPARPNGVLAPYWTDLDGAGAPGIRAATLTDGVKTWIVVQWNTHVQADASPAGTRTMQVWIGVNGTQDISYAYDPATVGRGTPAGTGLTVGAENVTGTAGAQITGPPAGSYVVSATPGLPGGSLSYSLTIQGKALGAQALTSTLDSDVVVGTTRVRTPVAVTR